uniref:Vacuolar protein sorting-associated protein 18 homolog n=1 Tax=Tanacetum cinerariifolium TaxID=118510 RepID=A0A6L2NIX7_TANCI|nr:vacuolar protein sorting-associated protein 18 homolog [Tanacetum cinerariifolium]
MSITTAAQIILYSFKFIKHRVMACRWCHEIGREHAVNNAKDVAGGAMILVGHEHAANNAKDVVGDTAVAFVKYKNKELKSYMLCATSLFLL